MRREMCMLPILMLFTLTACGEKEADTTEAIPDMACPRISARVELLQEEQALLVHECLIYTNCQEEELHEIYLYAPPDAFAVEHTTVEAFSIEIEETAFSYDSSDPSLLCVIPESPLVPGGRMRITMEYRLKPPAEQASFGVVHDAYELDRLFFAPACYQDGWQLNSSYGIGEYAVLEAAEYTVEVIAPHQYQVAASGKRTGERTKEDGIIFTSHFARDFALYLSPDDLKKTVVDEGLSLHFYYDEMQTHYINHWIESAQSALNFYQKTFGPLETTEISLVFTNHPLSTGGKECSDLMFFYFGELLDQTKESVLQEMDMVIAHELAHQWFYHLLGNNQGMEPFLDEGFATWAETMYLREQGHFDVATLEMLHQNFETREEEGKPLLRQNIYDFSELGGYTFDIYYGGASLLYQMEKSLGKEQFASLLHNYVTHFRQEFVTIEAFLSYWHNAVGSALDPLFALYLGE